MKRAKGIAIGISGDSEVGWLSMVAMGITIRIAIGKASNSEDLRGEVATQKTPLK